MIIATPLPLGSKSEPAANLGRVHLCNGLDPRRDGGMVPSILGFAGALARRGGPLTIVTPTPSRRDQLNIPAGVDLIGPVRNLEAHVRRAEVLHIHGLWQGHGRRGAHEARRSCVPYLVAAHGMAEPWALRHKALKKRVYTALVEGTNLRRADCLHALSRPEIRHLRALAPDTPICLAPNGVDLAPFENLPDRLELERDHPELREKFVLLFYGRLHVKKGLDLLATAAGAVKNDFPRLHLLLAGNDDGAWEDFRRRAEGLGLADRITYVGHVAGEASRRVWSRADAFVLPSYSEGFSMAILEALAARKPTLVTHACHFPELAKTGGGIVVDADAAGVTAGLRELLERSDAERSALADRGRRLVETNHTWDIQAERLSNVYRWIVDGGSIPASVVPPGEVA